MIRPSSDATRSNSNGKNATISWKEGEGENKDAERNTNNRSIYNLLLEENKRRKNHVIHESIENAERREEKAAFYKKSEYIMHTTRRGMRRGMCMCYSS